MTFYTYQPTTQAKAAKRLVWILATVVFLLVACFFVWKETSLKEPMVQGRSLTAWLDQYRDNEYGLSADEKKQFDEAKMALLQVGKQATPFLAKMLQRRDSYLMSNIFVFMGRHSRAVGFDYRPAWLANQEAACGFECLGADGKDAVPEILQIMRLNVTEFSQEHCIESLGYIGPSASNAIPELLPLVTNASPLRIAAISALGRIHALPEVGVPALLGCILDPKADGPTKANAAYGLAGYGPAAGEAVPYLKAMMNDPRMRTRIAVSNALEKIAPPKDGTRNPP